MARETTSLPLSLPAPAAGVPLYRWLYEQLRAAILEGRLHPGARLPAIRDVGEMFRLSRATVVTAFEQLKSEGYVEGRTGSGTYVSKVLPEQLLLAGGLREEGRLPHLRISLSACAKRLQPFRSLPAQPVRAFRANQPALDLFPTALWAQVASRRLRRASTKLLGGWRNAGIPSSALREAVAEYLNTSRGVRCTPDQVLIVSGAQEGLDRTARLLLNPGEPADGGAGVSGGGGCPAGGGGKNLWGPGRRRGIGFATWNPALAASETRVCDPSTPVPAGCDDEPTAAAHAAGMGAQSGDDDLRRRLRQRVPLLGAARAGSAGTGSRRVVIFGGSFSAVMFPAMRLGYLAVPPEMVDVFAAAQSVSTHHPPLLGQAVLCDFISEGHFARHIRRMREVYAERLNVLLKAAREQLEGAVEISSVEAGLQTIGWLRGKISAEGVARAAAEKNVEVVPLSRYAFGRARGNGIVLGFAAVESKELRRGVEDLARVLREKQA